MNKITNTFHTSKRATAISSAAKLSKVQAHNDRGYLSFYYSPDKICTLIGETGNISEDVKNYINEKFQDEIERYNEKQKRSDRKINQDAFDYFSENKNLDIANEMIFQVGDQNFWKRFRIEKTVKIKSGKEKKLYDYPDQIKEIMNEIYLKQALAYEKIYETDRKTIINKIESAYEKAAKIVTETAPGKRKEFERIIKIKDKEKRIKEFCRLSETEKLEFTEFREAFEEVSMIQKLRLRERIQEDDLQIKLISLKTHYDEKSTHGHGISVCSASGYKSGLSCRVAKSVVLNKYALEVIQDKMREIAIEEMEKHPEIFAETELAEKGKGRNWDYTKEELILMKQAELVDKVMDLQSQCNYLQEKITEFEKQRKEAERQTRIANENAKKEIEDIKTKEKQHEFKALQRISAANTRVAQAEAAAKEWDEKLKVIANEKEYIEESNRAHGVIETLQELIKRLVERPGITRDRRLEESIMGTFQAFYDALTESLQKLRKYEIRKQLPKEECESIPISQAKISLDNQISSGADTVLQNRNNREASFKKESDKKYR